MINQIKCIGLDTPLADAVNKLFKREVKSFDIAHQLRYIQYLCCGNVDKLRQALDEIDKAVEDWKGRYFMSEYKRKWETDMDKEESDDIFFAERQYRESGKTELTADFLYNEIERYGFIDEQHCRAVETAWHFGDLEFLRTQWEDSVLEQIRSLRGIITDILVTAPEPPRDRVQMTNRPLKKIEDYPEIFNLEICCELTGYSKNTIYKLTSKNEIPCSRAGKNGRLLKFKRDEIVEWMLAQRQETKDEFIKRMGEELASRLQ